MLQCTFKNRNWLLFGTGRDVKKLNFFSVCSVCTIMATGVLCCQGPVYSVQWSPFNSNVFLSSSTDWDVKIWLQDSPHAAFSLTSPLVSAVLFYFELYVKCSGSLDRGKQRSNHSWHKHWQFQMTLPQCTLVQTSDVVLETSAQINLTSQTVTFSVSHGSVLYWSAYKLTQLPQQKFHQIWWPVST